jgi:iron(II)-dependent oxidoreductase
MNTSAQIGAAIRCADAQTLAQALCDSRRDTLARFAQGQAEGAAVPLLTELNPALWELGHVGWFQTWWLARNPQRDLGPRADPQAPRPQDPGDAVYDSSQVAHDSRWQLALPGAQASQHQLAAQLQQTLALLRQAPAGDDALYFFRLALLHEDMHHEAALYMAQSLGWAVEDPRWQPRPLPAANPELTFDAAPWRLGWQGPGFAFDNELAAHPLPLPATRIDSRVVRWAEYLPFVEAGGYAQAHQARWWSEAGQAWLARQGESGAALPRYLRRTRDSDAECHDRDDPAAAAQGWQQWRWGRWQALDLALPACHLSCFEAEAWCRWAGRRLPTEAEWERAAVERATPFDWGAVWEWTADAFAAYPGFIAHPYRDYSAPWFGSRRVLRGAACVTQPRLHHVRYRNFFPPERNDIFAGFRSCAV